MTIHFPPQREAKTTVRALCTNISELLSAFSTSTVPQMAVCNFPGGRYVQFWASANSAIGEVVSNTFLDDEMRWSNDQELSLEAAGWCAPNDASPNWHIERRGDRAHVAVAVLTVRAIVDSLGYGTTHANDPVVVQTFASTTKPRK